MVTFLNDVRFALRVFRRNVWLFSFEALVLATGVAVSVIVFALLSSIFFRPLPFPNSGEMVFIERFTTGDVVRAPAKYSWPVFDFIRRDNPAFTAFAGYNILKSEIAGLAERPLSAENVMVTEDFFTLFQTRPLLGRVLTANDFVDKTNSAVLSYQVWTRKLNSDPSVVGRPVAINGAAYNVVGVLPPDLEFPEGETVYTPYFSIQSEGVTKTAITAVARLRPGFSARDAQPVMAALEESAAQQFPGGPKNVTVRVVPLQEMLTGNFRISSIVLFLCALVLFGVICVNIGNFQIVKSLERGKEVAVRVAVGASRGRILRQFVTESLVFSIGGVALGVAFAVIGLRYLPSMVPVKLPFWMYTNLDASALIFAGMLALVASLVFGLFPAFHVLRVDVNAALKSSTRGGTQTGKRYAQQLVVSIEVALGLVLTASAILLGMSFSKLFASQVGFAEQNLVTLHVNARALVSDEKRVVPFAQEIFRNVNALPGVTSSAAVAAAPFVGRIPSGRVIIPSNLATTGSNKVYSGFQFVIGDYFETMRIALVAGNGFSASDQQQNNRVAIVDQAFADAFFPSENPIGKTLNHGFVKSRLTIIGVVRSVQHENLGGQSKMVVYVPASSEVWAEFDLVVRTARDPAGLLRSVARAVSEVSPAIVVEPKVVATLVKNSMWRERLFLTTFMLMTSLAVVLSLTGIYTMVAFIVRSSRQEIGIRAALGCAPKQLLYWVLMKGLQPTLVGLVLGIPLTIVGVRYLKNVMSQVGSSPWTACSLGMLLLVIVSVVACLVPAVYALRIRPSEALKNE